MAKEHRPVPLPNRPQASTSAPAAMSQGKRPSPPPGAVKWAKVYLDHRGVPVESAELVPVDENDRRTAHVLHACPGFLVPDGSKEKVPCDSTAWLEPDAPKEHCRWHGVALAPTEDVKRKPLLPWAQMWQAVAPSARPVWLLLAEAAAGAIERTGHVPATWPMLAAPALAGGGYIGVRWRLRARAIKRGDLEKGERSGRRWETILRRARSAGYLGATAGAWLTLADLFDPHSIPGKVAWTLLPIAWGIGSYPWWRYQGELRNRPAPTLPPDPPEPLGPTDDDLSAAEDSKRWAEDAGVPNTKVRSGSWKRIPCGRQMVVEATKRGALNALGGDQMKLTIRKIAAAFDVPKSAVTWIEEYDDNPNLAQLLVQPNNPLREGQVWPGPGSVDIVKGVAEVGRLINGDPMTEVMYRYGWGAPSEVILGTTGAGKSVRIKKKLVMERWASFVDPLTNARRGTFISILHDPKRLESYAEFRRALPAYGITRDDAHIIVDALLREMIRRYDFLASLPWHDKKGRKREGSIPWSPLTHGPIISVYWDEFHELAGDKAFVPKLEKLARYQRACGMRAGLASHMATISDTGSQALRDLLAGGRATLFRTTSGLNGPLATGGQVAGDPRGLPKEPGMCFVADGETLAVLGRESYIPSGENDDTLYDFLFDDDNNPVGYPADIPKETAEAFGREFMEWAAAGRQSGGRGNLPSGKAVAHSDDDLRAEAALRQILFESSAPLLRKQISDHPLWGFGVTSTLTAALRKGQDADPPWAVRDAKGSGVMFELGWQMRQQMTDALTEEQEPAAA